jgi:hypothetical protein
MGTEIKTPRINPKITPNEVRLREMPAAIAAPE